jgi:uncharacterized protein YjiS (DUF1127 family)
MTIFTNHLSHVAFDNRWVAMPRSGWLAAAGARLDHALTALLDWQERSRQRHQLLSLDITALKDFGRSAADACGEAEKPFWRG